MDTETIRYQYLTDCGYFIERGGKFKSSGALCIAYRFNTDGSLSFGASFCSPKDRYEKKTGRASAEKRLTEQPTTISISGDVPHALMRDVMRRTIPTLKYTPRWFTRSIEAEWFCSGV